MSSDQGCDWKLDRAFSSALARVFSWSQRILKSPFKMGKDDFLLSFFRERVKEGMHPDSAIKNSVILTHSNQFEIYWPFQNFSYWRKNSKNLLYFVQKKYSKSFPKYSSFCLKKVFWLQKDDKENDRLRTSIWKHYFDGKKWNFINISIWSTKMSFKILRSIWKSPHIPQYF